MNTYELTIVMPEGDDVARIVKLVAEFAKKTKGEVNKQESWGVKTLAYMIKKRNVADFEHFVLTLESSQQPLLDKMLKMDESILRYMFVKVS